MSFRDICLGFGRSPKAHISNTDLAIICLLSFFSSLLLFHGTKVTFCNTWISPNFRLLWWRKKFALATRECKNLIFQEVSSRAGCDWESVYSFPRLHSCSLGHILGQPSQNLQTLKDMKIEMAASFLLPLPNY